MTAARAGHADLRPAQGALVAATAACRRRNATVLHKGLCLKLVRVPIGV